jgi:hypothetical protein
MVKSLHVLFEACMKNCQHLILAMNLAFLQMFLEALTMTMLLLQSSNNGSDNIMYSIVFSILNITSILQSLDAFFEASKTISSYQLQYFSKKKTVKNNTSSVSI